LCDAIGSETKKREAARERIYDAVRKRGAIFADRIVQRDGGLQIFFTRHVACRAVRNFRFCALREDVNRCELRLRARCKFDLPASVSRSGGMT